MQGPRAGTIARHRPTKEEAKNGKRLRKGARFAPLFLTFVIMAALQGWAAMLASAATGALDPTFGSNAAPAADEPYFPAGMIGVTSHQSAELSVSNVASTDCTAILQLVDSNGALVASRSVAVRPAASATFRYNPRLPTGARLELRPVVVSVGGSCTAFLPTLQVVDTASGRVLVAPPFLDNPIALNPGARATDVTYYVHPLTRVAQGKTAMFTLSNVAATDCTAVLDLVDASGAVVGTSRVTVGGGHSASMVYVPPTGSAAQIRAEVVSVGDSCTALVTSLQIIDVASQRTDASISFIVDPTG